MTVAFALTFDYRCPFARVAHKHVMAALRDGADLDVTWVPFSLKQVHVGEGEPDIWERPDDDSGLLALQAGIAVRDHDPDHFLAVHEGLFDARHAHGLDLRDPAVVKDVLAEAGADVDKVVALIGEGQLIETIRREHHDAVDRHRVWGVPTFIAGDRAVFVRLMEPPVDAADARRTVDRLLDLVIGWPELNEFKATSIPR